MKIHYSFDFAGEIKNPVVTTGTFDGVHAGHQVIIRRLNKLAEDIGGESVLITFHPHPRKILYPETLGKDLQLICTQDEKKALLEETGLHHLIVLEFTRDFAQITSRQFVEDFLIGMLSARIVVVGYNHHFGHNREGDFSYLYQLSRKHGFEVEEIPEQDIQNESVSSTKIRAAIKEGNIQRANAYLDHFYSITGHFIPEPVHTEYFNHPVFRITKSEKEKLIPPPGVYAVNISTSGKIYKGLFSISNPEENQDSRNPDIFLEFCFMDKNHPFSSGEAQIFFHKKIRNGTVNGSSVQMKALFMNDLKEIYELIY